MVPFIATLLRHFSVISNARKTCCALHMNLEGPRRRDATAENFAFNLMPFQALPSQLPTPGSPHNFRLPWSCIHITLANSRNAKIVSCNLRYTYSYILYSNIYVHIKEWSNKLLCCWCSRCINRVNKYSARTLPNKTKFFCSTWAACDVGYVCTCML